MSLDVTTGNNAGVRRELQLGISRLEDATRRARAGWEEQLRPGDVVGKSDSHLHVGFHRSGCQCVDFKGGANGEDSDSIRGQ